MQARMLRQTKRSMWSRMALWVAAIVVGGAATLAFTLAAMAAPDQQPKTTHPVQGRENCQSCHPVGGGVKAAPASHSTYTNATCLGCHPAGEPAVASTETAAPEAPKPAGAASTPPSPVCMDCHKNQSLAMDLPSGERLSLFVDEEQMGRSVHQGKLGCTDCHSRITGYPHKATQVNSKREYSIAQYEACKRCHFANYTKTLDSMHYQIMESGNKSAPLCTDCHGYHNVSVPDEPRSKISGSCATCHKETYETYAQSVHGAALIKDENKDVPVCTDCHGTHTIRDPNGASFRLDSPEMCAKCHSDETMMARYDLSPNVFKTYVQDFHGTTVALAKQQGIDNWTDKAVCSDCHGVHNIKSVKNADPIEIKKNMVSTCQKCHPDASTNFPDAWLGHYEISPEKAPLPWMVRAWYVVLIPFMIGGLMLHIILDLWRIARNR